VPAAHTDGDSYIHFVGQNIVHLGDVFRTVGYPGVDAANGGTVKGTLEALQIAIDMGNAETKYLPGHGVVSSREAIVEFRDMVAELQRRFSDLIRQGMTLEQVVAAKPTADLDARWGMPVDDSGASHRAIEAAGCDVVVAEPDARRARLAELARGAHALLGATFREGLIDRELLELAPELRIVSKYTIGVDDVDIDAANELGILVAYCPTEANWGGVAEGTIAFMLTLLKRIRERDRQVKAGGWRDPPFYGTYLGARGDGYPGIVFGIVGLGRVGSRVAELLAPWRVRVLACDPFVPREKFERYGAERVGLDELLARADVVSLHCNLTSATRGLIGREQLAAMRRDAILINTARGAIVDLAAAALDVLPQEPPAEARLLDLGDRVLLSPHMIAANQGGTLGPAIPWATAATLAALRGEVPAHVYNAEAVPRWRARFSGRSLLPTQPAQERSR
jgi:phosphoglycerate dehydrogenase-like enzyme